jgi:hypothetical protein
MLKKYEYRTGTGNMYDQAIPYFHIYCQAVTVTITVAYYTIINKI